MEVKEAKKVQDLRGKGSIIFLVEAVKYPEDVGKQGCQSANGSQEASQQKW